MHYYSFNIADYRKDTSHLTPIEHYIYRQLIDWYYLDENPIPKKTQSVIRRLGLVSENEPLLLNVLNDFFEERENGWFHGRISEEIERYHNKKSANAENGRKGGRPKKQQLTEAEKPKKTQSVNFDNPTESELKPNQEPITNNHIKTYTQNPPESGKPDPCPHQQIVDLYLEVLPELAGVRDITEQRKRKLRARWKSQDRFRSLDWWRRYFEHVRESDFLMGREKDWQASFDFLIDASSFQKVLEGVYHRGVHEFIQPRS